ncbi:hypothetical protein TNCV_4171231 [Trichonephila clavipes]|nr:hypothetical protein TNCV_4171231 [Trichonephila clavipes]
MYMNIPEDESYVNVALQSCIRSIGDRPRNCEPQSCDEDEFPLLKLPLHTNERTFNGPFAGGSSAPQGSNP